MKKIFFKFGTTLASLTLMITAFNVNATCMMFVHQPKLPDGAKKLQKF